MPAAISVFLATHKANPGVAFLNDSVRPSLPFGGGRLSLIKNAVRWGNVRRQFGPVTRRYPPYRPTDKLSLSAPMRQLYLEA